MSDNSTIGYTVPNLQQTQNYVIVNAVALFIAYAVNFFFQIIASVCFNKDQKYKTIILQRLLENSRVMYWFGIATMFSVFPPFYYGFHNAIMGWITLLFVVLMHVFTVIRRCDQERSLWSYFYYFYHMSIGIWIAASLIKGIIQSQNQQVPADSIQN